MDPETKILKFSPERAMDSNGASEQERPMEAQAQTSTTAVLPPPASPANEPPPPIWMQRFFLVTTVMICLWIGFVLAVLPWQPAWTENALVNNSPNLRWFLGTGFVRGLATGLGVLDLWIGISEAVHYRDRR
jgi:hypothetical protein